MKRMATLTTSGIEELELSLNELAALPDSMVCEMLAAEGEVIKAAQVRKVASALTKSGERLTGQLGSSIVVNRKLRKKKDERYITVYPRGQRAQTSKGRPVRNAEVGFVLEFGAPGRHIAPTQWMRSANEEAADKAVQAAEQVYDAWLKSKGL